MKMSTDFDYAAFLLEQAAQPSATLHEFQILWDDGGDKIHIFVEGDDDAVFYLPEIRRRSDGRAIEVYNCKGKPKLSVIRETVYSNVGKNSRCLFFVDRDYDGYLDSQIVIDDYTYITDFYSIENYICGKLSVDIILTDFMKISRADPCFQFIIDSYDKLEAEFADRVIFLMAWIVAFREAHGRPNLSNCTSFDKVFKVSREGPICIHDNGFAYFRRVVGAEAHSPPIGRVRYWVRRFLSEPVDGWLRGKYKHWFFRKALMSVIAAVSDERVAAGGGRLSTPAVLRNNLLFESMAGRVVPPLSLVHFLNSNIRRP